MRTPSTAIRGVFVSFIILGVVFISIINGSGSVAVGHPYQDGTSNVALNDLTLTPSPSPTPTPPLLSLHFPLVFKVGKIELTGAWISNSDGNKQYGFLPGDTLQFVVEIANQSGFDASVKLTWVQDGPCEQNLVMNEEFILEPGISKKIGEGIAPDCLGVSTNSIELTYGLSTESLEFKSVVIHPSSVIVAEGQGFDNCTLPSVSQMGTWWGKSPYSTINIYIGGISAACPMNRDSAWLYQVAKQGWSFILTWVGPQAPCTSFNHPMSRDPATARQQGRNNADAAVATAKQRGFLGDLVIYYDLESYSRGKDDPGCRAAVDSFMQGWVEGIHALGHTAGAYGAACTSFMSEWADNDDPPDDVWFAHWYTNNYDPDATVWNVPCIDDLDEPPELWINHQRLKQYTGGHKETWGGLQMSIDSNVLDGQVSAILGLPLTQASHPELESTPSPEIVKVIEPALRDLQVLSPREGWVLRGDHLYWTGDGGASWQDISPSPGGREEILGVAFLDTQRGWLLRKQYEAGHVGTLSVLQTDDSGQTWHAASVLISEPEEVFQIASAALEFVDPQTGWIALKLHSGSNFSFGRLLATEDGGRTWQERTLPLGEPVAFKDAKRGWISGGPLDQTFYTEDGGESWNLTESFPEDLSLGQAALILPSLAIDDQRIVGELLQGMVALDMLDTLNGWAVVQDGFCSGYKPRAGESIPPGSSPLQCESSSQLLMTTDGGISWRDISPP